MKFYILSVLLMGCLIFSAAQASDNGLVKSHVQDLSHFEFNQKLSNDSHVVIVDVRTAAEYESGHVPNAVNIPHTAILNNIDLLAEYKDQDMIFYCRSGYRASKVTDKLIDENTLNGRTIYHLDGDMKAWTSAGQAIEK